MRWKWKMLNCQRLRSLQQSWQLGLDEVFRSAFRFQFPRFFIMAIFGSNDIFGSNNYFFGCKKKTLKDSTVFC